MFTSSIRARLAKAGYKSVNDPDIEIIRTRITRLPGVANDPKTSAQITRILREELNNDYDADDSHDFSVGTEGGNGYRGKARKPVHTLPGI